MNEPTAEQIKRFWEWCGLQYFPQIIVGGHIERLAYWSYHGRDVTEYLGAAPEIDLNNLFEWAVPTLKDTCEEWWSVIVEWAKDITGNYEKDTLALFWAINKVIEED